MATKIFIASLIALIGTASASAAGRRIVADVHTTVDKVPYVAQIIVQTHGEVVFACGATIVSSIHVITAAHCVDGVPAGKAVVTTGTTMLFTIGETRRIAKTFIHPLYNDPAPYSNDVAVLKLESPLPFNDLIQAMPLCSKEIPAGGISQVSGWTLTQDNHMMRNLKSVHLPRMPQASCVHLFAPGVVTESMMCSDVSAWKDACKGDTGGPVIYHGELCGIVSWGYHCEYPEYPGVYTNVHAPIVNKFIRDAMKL